MRNIFFIVLHCTGGPQHQKLASIQAFWRRKGWKRPGYHHLVDAAGTNHVLAPIDRVTNGVAGFNANAIHIAYTGGVGRNGEILDNRTQAQRATLLQLVRQYRQQFPNAIILGHRDFSRDKNRNGIIDPAEWHKACPSFSVAQWLAENNIPNPRFTPPNP